MKPIRIKGEHGTSVVRGVKGGRCFQVHLEQRFPEPGNRFTYLGRFTNKREAIAVAAVAAVAKTVEVRRVGARLARRIK